MRHFRVSVRGLGVLVFLAVVAISASALGAERCYVHPRVQQNLAENGSAQVIVSLWDEALPQARAKEWPDRIPAVAELTRRAIAAAPGFQVGRTYQIFPFLAGTVDAEALDRLARCPIVEGIYPDREVRASLAESGPLVGQPAAEGGGWTGAGMGIAIVDTGIDYTHPDLGAPAPYPNPKVRGGYDFANNDTNPYDDHGHGTHVASIAAGTGATNRGMAPGAHLLAVKVLDAGGGGTTSGVIAGVEWCIVHKVEFNIRVINMSIGDGVEWTDPADCDDLPESQAIKDAVAGGIFVAVASGNEGYLNGLSFPACVSVVTAVGATYDETRDGGTVDTPTYYSNRGELLDLFAPGSFIMAAKRGGGYIEHEGTSMAAPHVAGAAAVLAQRGLATPADIEKRLKVTGTAIVDPDTHIQTMRIDIGQAVTGPPTSGPDLVVTAVSVSATTLSYGDTVTISITVKNQGNAASGAISKTLAALSANAVPSPQDTPLDVIGFPSLAAGSSSTKSAAITVPEIPRGTYYLIGFADQDYEITETDESNNGYVGGTVRVGYTATVASTSIPEFMLPGGTYLVSVTIRNDGDSIWTAADGFELAATSPDGNSRWGISSAALPGGLPVLPGATVAFNFNVTAPTEPDFYPCHWQMRRGTSGFFGEVATGASRVLVVNDTVYGQNYPAVDGNRVVYEDQNSTMSWNAVSAKDLNTGVIFTIPDDVREPPNPDFNGSNNWYPDISGTWMTWMVDDVAGWVSLPQYDLEGWVWFWQIAAFNLAAPYDVPTQVTYQTADAWFPAIDNGRIVWEDYTNDEDRMGFVGFDDPDVLIYDINDGRMYPVCVRTGGQFAPRISGDLVVWEDWTNGQGDIYLYDLSVDTDHDGVPNWKDPDRPTPDPAELRLTDSPWDEMEPDISGRTVVWLDMRQDTGLFQIVDIYALDLDSMVQTPVADDPACYRDHVRIAASQVVWNDYRFGAPDVYWTDLAIPDISPIPIAGSAGWEVVPDIGGRRVVYGEWRPDYWVWNVVTQRLFTHGCVGVHTFTDVTNDHWAWAYIEAVADHGIATGYPNGGYQPEAVVSRDQMAVYLARAKAGGDAYVPPGPGTPSFTDVAASYWAYDYIEYCANAARDIVRGYGDGTYRPTLPVDRGAMAVFVARAKAGGEAAVPAGPPTPSFPDVTATNSWSWCYKHVEYIKAQSIASGYPDGLYHPETQCTRAQMAVYVSRAFGY